MNITNIDRDGYRSRWTFYGRYTPVDGLDVYVWGSMNFYGVVQTYVVPVAEFWEMKK